jgi:hypothetical protein
LIYGFNKLQRMIVGNPDQGWRARYNAAGTEEWAVDEAIAARTEAADAAYDKARGLAREASDA